MAEIHLHPLTSFKLLPSWESLQSLKNTYKHSVVSDQACAVCGSSDLYFSMSAKNIPVKNISNIYHLDSLDFMNFLWQFLKCTCLPYALKVIIAEA